VQPVLTIYFFRIPSWQGQSCKLFSDEIDSVGAVFCVLNGATGQAEIGVEPVRSDTVDDMNRHGHREAQLFDPVNRIAIRIGQLRQLFW
jgi:hypothetical protein